MCYDVCPGKGYTVNKWVKEKTSNDIIIDKERGPVKEYLLGHSTDPDIRLNSASGGIATSLIMHLIESGTVDEAAVLVMENERPALKITKDFTVIKSAMESKYGPVPILADLIPELKKRPRKIVMTAIPCQLGGLFYAMEKIPKLKKSEIITIGLFCGQIQSYDSLTAIASTIGVKYPEESKFVAWRYGPYPGSCRFIKKDGTAAEKPLYPWLDVAVPLFSLKRCFLCPDGGNWLSDMTLGDIHAGGTDETVTVCRTERAFAVLKSAEQAGKIEMSQMNTEQIEKCVIKGITGSKMLPAISRNLWLKKKGEPHSEFDYDTQGLLKGKKSKMAIVWVIKYRLTFFLRTGWRRTFLLKYPYLLEKTGHFLYVFPKTVPGFKASVNLINIIIRLTNLIRRKK